MEENKQEKSQQDLIMSDEFEKALVTGAEVQNNDIPLCKSRNKNNYAQFFELMVASDREIRSIMDMKKKDRKDEDEKKLKQFKKNTSKSYTQICKLLADLDPDTQEEAEDDEPSNQNQETSLEKMVHNITNIAKLLSYIGVTALEDEFKKSGIELKYEPLDKNETFAQDHIKKEVKGIFELGKEIKKDIQFNKNRITDEIYSEAVPLDLQYDKNENPTGIKKTDFSKLVDIKAQLLSSSDNEDQQEKAKDKAEKLATEYVFQNRRNELLNKKVTEFAS